MNRVLASCLMAAAIAVFLAGCEHNSGVNHDEEAAATGSAGFSISPASVELDAGAGHTAFTVNGGEPPFVWSVSDTSLGSISASPTTARTVTYTPAQSGKSGVNAVGVTDAKDWIATATVVQGDALTVTLSTGSISTNVSHKVTATVVGGTAPYSWSASDGLLGTISSSSGNTATYTSHKGRTGTLFIIAEDEYGWTGHAELVQQ